MKFKGISDLSVARIANSMGDTRVVKIHKGAQRVYVGTWEKYNQGNIGGAWLDMDDYDSMEEFMEAATNLHRDEADPELMMQDWEDMPEWAVSVHGVDPKYFEYKEVVEPENADAFDAFLSNYYPGGISDNLDLYDIYENQFREAYVGEFDSLKSYARQMADEIYDNGYLYEYLKTNTRTFDVDSYASDYEMSTDDAWMYFDERMISDQELLSYFDYDQLERDLDASNMYLIDGYLFDGDRV